MLAKQRVREVLDRLPDDCTIDDVLYHLYVIKSIEKGIDDVEAGRTIPHKQVVEELRKKWLVGDEA
jgi:predicted transcriptional regulator